MEGEDAADLLLGVSLGLSVSDDAAPNQLAREGVDIEHFHLERVPVVHAGVGRVVTVSAEAPVLRPGNNHFAAFLDDQVENFVDVVLADFVVFDDHSLTTGVATLMSITGFSAS